MDSENTVSRIPSFRRSASVRVRGERTHVINTHLRNVCEAHSFLSQACKHDEHDEHHGRSLSRTSSIGGVDLDAESVKSCESYNSLASCGSVSQKKDKNVDSKNGSKKFILHCQRHFETPQEKYLTPTQRKEKEIRQLKSALARCMKTCEEKNSEIEQLKDELKRLHFVVSQGSQVSEDQEACDQQALNISSSPGLLEDSGVVSDVPSFKIESSRNETQECCKTLLCIHDQNEDMKKYETKIVNTTDSDNNCDNFELKDIKEEESLKDRGRDLKDLDDFKMKYQNLKERYNDKVEDLLQKLSDLNSKYLELRPAYEVAQDRIRYLESQLSEVRKEMSNQEEWHSQMYLKMYRKGQEAAKFEHADEVMEFASRAPSRVSVPELVQQLQNTENELEKTKELYKTELYQHSNRSDRQAEYTLRFLKDAVFYFLTDRDNKGHLHAIQSILGFTEAERIAVAKAMRRRRL